MRTHRVFWKLLGRKGTASPQPEFSLHSLLEPAPAAPPATATCYLDLMLPPLHGSWRPSMMPTFPGGLLPALTERGRCFRVWWKHSCWQSSDQSWACLCDRARVSRVSWRCSLRRGLEPSPSAACACRHPSLRLSPTSWAETVPSEIPCTGHFISLWEKFWYQPFFSDYRYRKHTETM